MIRFVVAVAALIAAVAIGAWLGRGDPVEVPACVTAREVVTVRGESLGLRVPAGATLELWRDAYRCGSPARGELVAVELPGKSAPLAKVVAAIPGDAFTVEPAEGGFLLRINGELAKNSAGEAYRVDARGYRVLGYFAKNLEGRIPEQRYLVLGERATNTTDSRVFGLVSQEELIGRLVER